LVSYREIKFNFPGSRDGIQLKILLEKHLCAPCGKRILFPKVIAWFNRNLCYANKETLLLGSFKSFVTSLMKESTMPENEPEKPMLADKKTELTPKELSGVSEEVVEAFSLFYRQTAPDIHAYLRRLCGSPHLAEDLLQETFLAAFRCLADFEGRSSPRTWVHAIATNKFRDYLRNRWGKVDIDSEKLDALPSIEHAPLEAAIQGEECRRTRGAISALPPELRAPLLLVRFEGMKYRDAAQVLGITQATVRMRIHRAHRILAQTLGEINHGQR
jgi:RNA polymerase sigma-70 factor (ECF subfamily)